MRGGKERWEGRHTKEDLSRDDLMFLLSILEGELQVGSFLKSPIHINPVVKLGLGH